MRHLSLVRASIAAAVATAVLTKFAIGCGKGDRKEITQTRVVEQASTPAAPETTAAESKSGSSKLPPGHPEVPQTPSTSDMMQATPTAPELSFTTPEGWQSAPPKPMRAINFRVGPAQEAECYVSVLANSGGGVPMNVNRWRGQMGLQPLTDTELAALPKITIAGQDGVLVEAAGQYTAMTGDPKPGYMLLGAICEREGQGIFVKMTGPEAIVKGEKDHFVAFCQSLK